jgi:serine/threonine-protein kinase
VNPVEGESALTYETDLLYVAPGAYRAKVLVENRIYWQSCSVEPLANPGKKEPRVQRIALSYDRSTTSRFRSCESSTPCPGATYPGDDVVVLERDLGFPLIRCRLRAAHEGAIRKFRAESKGYSRAFSLRSSGQDELRLARARAAAGATDGDFG